MSEKKKRIQKVYYGYHTYMGRPHPVIRLGGKYLLGFNFKIGDNIEIMTEIDRIVITKVSN